MAPSSRSRTRTSGARSRKIVMRGDGAARSTSSFEPRKRPTRRQTSHQEGKRNDTCDTEPKHGAHEAKSGKGTHRERSAGVWIIVGGDRHRVRGACKGPVASDTYAVSGHGACR